jgi:hypothetical protein
MGEVAENYEKQLKNKIKEKLSFYTKVNQEETKNNMLKLLQKCYSLIEYKITSNDLKTVDDIENEFRQLEYKINETFINFEFKDEIFNDFKSKILSFATDFFQNKMQNEINLIKSENSQIINNLQIDITDMKSNFEKEINKKASSITDKNNEINNLKSEISEIKDKLAVLEKENEIYKKNSSEKMEYIKDDYERQIIELTNKLQKSEDKSKEAERRALTVQAEADKEKALLDQKIELLSKQNDDYTKREKDSGVELKSHIKEQTIAFKESTSKYENQIKLLNELNEQLKEKVLDLEGNLSNKEHYSELDKNKLEELSLKFNLEKEDLMNKLNNLKQKLESEK